MKINFREIVHNTFFAGLEYVVVQKNTINVYNVHKFFLYQKFEDLDDIVESRVIKINDAFWLLYLMKNRGSMETLKISHELGYPKHTLKLFNQPVKLMNMDSTGQYAIFLAENDKELVIIDCYNLFKIIKRVTFTGADKRWDDVLKHPLVFIGLVTSEIIIMLNNKGVFRVLDLGLPKPHVLNVTECQKYFKFDFAIKESIEYIPRLMDDLSISSIIKTDSVNPLDPMSDLTIVN